ncbi:MAG: DUF2484 family protein [Roseovarius confluentis]|uniref:DUF2484 family protein n=1 Tax=Roseovarius sp. TaxID=1486281 RepID=UPI0032EDFA16
MSLSLILACLWCVVANVIAMFPSKHSHWPAAYVLIALGLPLLGFVVWQNGVWVGLIVLAAAASILRWPVRYLVRWVSGLFGARAEG